MSIEEGEAMKCPKCGSEDVKVFTISNTLYCECGKCGHVWKTDLQEGIGDRSKMVAKIVGKWLFLRRSQLSFHPRRIQLPLHLYISSYNVISYLT